ncbi:GntR family transcriptional regulator [Psychrobacillus soli]|uniref:GntR family transcriptional regulator n=1 Tax=Psychrobacillus soli TaxID=1543965 RepID=A0A544TGB9_9BACI|nr:GntR family transcriptional regulator [Psychrobacillus soli]TQR16491.1 GntR family transcriptional regulator [Psychrobacillus soli]
MLDKNDFTPLYIQLHRQLRLKIVNGEYKQGEAIPSETEMMKLFDTTRGTIRKALSLLVNEGLVHQVRGKGTFVRLSPLQYSITNFGGFTDYLKNRNEEAISKVLEQSRLIIDGTEYYQLTRVRGVKKEDVVSYLMIDTSLIPVSLFPDLDKNNFENESLYKILREQYRVSPTRSEISLSPVLVDDQMRKILELKDEEVALLKAEGNIYDQNNVRVEKVKIIYAPSIEFNIMTSINASI